MKKILFTLAALLTLTCAAFAADVSGKWTAQLQGRQGTQATTFTFKVSGNTVTGTVATERGENPIAEGKIDGDNISFVQNLSFNGNDVKLTYTGKVKGDTIEFTREGGRGSTTFTATKAK